jgi:hypothetical protein
MESGMQKNTAETVPEADIPGMQRDNADGVSGRIPEVFGYTSYRKFELSPGQLREMHAKGAIVSLVATSLGEDLSDILQ